MSKTFSGKQVVKALRKLGYEHLYTRGSHAVMLNKFLRIKVIVRLHRELKTGLLLSILKKVGITIKNLKELI